MPLFSAAALVLVAWGALVFGAEYAWAFAPLMVFAVATAVLGFRASRGLPFPSGAILLALAVVAGASVVQVLPMPQVVRDRAGARAPKVDYSRLQADVLQQHAEVAGRTLSIAARKTTMGIGFLLSLTALFWGCTRALAARGPRPIVRGIVVIGVVAALVGIAHASVRTEDVYGFWRAPKPGVAFAPFINPNHFAGWVVMALSLTTGWFTGRVANAPRHAQGGWRHQLLRLSSPTATETMLTGVSVVAMTLAMIVSFSRGGLIGLVTAAAMLSLWTWRKQRTSRRQLAGMAAVGVVLLMGAVWGGVERTLVRFGGSSLDWGGRKQVWLDTLRIIHDYPWTGTGLNTYGIAMLHYQTEPRGEYFIEAHNDYLQLAAEGGLLLGIPILITIALFIREVWKRFKEGADDERTYWLRAGAVTGLCSIAVMEIFDFTLQMPGAAVFFVVLAAIAIHRPDYLTRRRESRAHRE